MRVRTRAGAGGFGAEICASMQEFMSAIEVGSCEGKSSSRSMSSEMWVMRRAGAGWVMPSG